MTRDPICFAEIDQSSAANEGLLSQFNSQTFYFCCLACKDRFDRDPGAFIRTSVCESSDKECSDYYYG